MEKGDDRGGEVEATGGLPAGSAAQDTYDHPTAKIWSVYMSEAAPYDNATIESWLKDMDGILIFAGLFSASVTAFIIESYTGLMPDPNQQTIALLQQISQQLNGGSVQSQTSMSDSFTPTSSTLRVNAFWFLSLCLALTCALAAILVQQWARNYLQAIERRPAPYLQARVRSYLYEGLEKFRMEAVVEGIPTLLHASLFLFFAGLVDFLYSINREIAWVTLSIVAVVGFLYILITVLPVFDRQSPFRTPLSEIFWAICRYSGLLRYKSGGVWKRLQGNMWQGRQTVATDPLSFSNKRDTDALSWTLKSLTEDEEFLPFVEGIPAFCTVPEAKHAMRAILLDQDVQLLPRILTLLQACQESVSLPETSKRTRSVACLNAIASLSNVPAKPWQYLSQYDTTLYFLIVTLVGVSDSDISRAALKATGAMGEHIYRHLVSYAQSDRGEPIREALATLARWDLSPLLEMIPDLVRCSAVPSPDRSAGAEAVPVSKVFKNEVMRFFGDLDVRETLMVILGYDLNDDHRARRHALALMAAVICTFPEKVAAFKRPATEDEHLLRSWATSAEADFTEYLELLEYFMVDRGSTPVSQYARILAIQLGSCFQSRVADSGDPVIYSVASMFLWGVRDIDWERPTFTKRFTRLYATLPETEKLKLQALPGVDGSESLGACRGHIRLLIALLEPLSGWDLDLGFKPDLVKLIETTVINMKPYLNARWSCRRDQARLLELIKTLGAGMPSDAVDMSLAEVTSTISDPSLMEEAFSVLKGYLWIEAETEQFRIRLKTATPLEPLQDEDDPNDAPNGDSAAHLPAPVVSSSQVAGGERKAELPPGELEATKGPGINAPTPEATTTVSPHTMHLGVNAAAPEQGEAFASVERYANTTEDAVEAESDGDDITETAQVTPNRQEDDDGKTEINVGALFNPSPERLGL
ncbi:hypothetical protein HWV62_32477 [Athelia sp. TMB]|nr:hypothetical protein HWV62_32477 [Athelia sp. TMB]